MILIYTQQLKMKLRTLSAHYSELDWLSVCLPQEFDRCQSLQRGNAVIGVYINAIRDMRTLSKSYRENAHKIIGYNNDNSPVYFYFDKVADGIYDYVAGNGYANHGTWIESAARAHGK